MKAHLLFPDRDFDWEQSGPWNAEALKADFGLPVLFRDGVKSLLAQQARFVDEPARAEEEEGARDGNNSRWRAHERT